MSALGGNLNGDPQPLREGGVARGLFSPNGLILPSFRFKMPPFCSPDSDMGEEGLVLQVIGIILLFVSLITQGQK